MEKDSETLRFETGSTDLATVYIEFPGAPVPVETFKSVGAYALMSRMPDGNWAFAEGSAIPKAIWLKVLEDHVAELREELGSG